MKQVTPDAILAMVRQMPASVWHTTIPRTLLRIRNNVMEQVPDDYKPEQGDFVFALKNDDGYISFETLFSPSNEL